MQELAAQLASAAHRPPDADLPIELQDLSYDQYKDIRFGPDRTIALGDFGSACKPSIPDFCSSMRSSSI